MTQKFMVRLLFLGGLPLVPAVLTGCDRPCKTLADRLCEQAKDEAACDRWRDRVQRVSTDTCKAGIKALDRERLR
jgi:hypothetical protein